MSGGDQYVVAAYAVIWVVLLLYVVVNGMKTARLAREAELLSRLVAEREGDAGAAPAAAPAEHGGE
ncbi:MAG: CcmD family protein [Thermoleophilia bacterium]|nr:CcmD family protein [Thermoleophilia bacterium]